MFYNDIIDNILFVLRKNIADIDFVVMLLEDALKKIYIEISREDSNNKLDILKSFLSYKINSLQVLLNEISKIESQ